MTNRSRTNTPVIPSIQLYDSDTQTFTTVGEFHTWDTIAFKTTDFHYIADEDKTTLELPSAGYYEITFESSFMIATGSASITSQIWLNGTAIDGSKACGCAYNSGQANIACACVTLHFIVYLHAKDYIQIKTQNSLGSSDVVTVPEASRLIIKFIPTLGWDNSKGGNMNYRGGVVR